MHCSCSAATQQCTALQFANRRVHGFGASKSLAGFKPFTAYSYCLKSASKSSNDRETNLSSVATAFTGRHRFLASGTRYTGFSVCRVESY